VKLADSIYLAFVSNVVATRLTTRKGGKVVHDGEYFQKRAAEARAAAFRRDGGEDGEIAGQLALAYSALARRQKKQVAEAEPVIPMDVEA
jgi:hypothetical protein